MRKGIRIDGLDASSLTRQSPPAWLVAAMLGLAPIATSSAAAPEELAEQIDPSASAAVVEMVPLPPSIEDPDPAVPEEPAPSKPAETTLGRGSASYYANKFHGRRTANGERFDNGKMTAAHRTLTFGTRVRVTSMANGRSVVVRINDRGPFTRGRLIDLSRAAAAELGLITRGHGTVELTLVDG
jgi:rare lipoprotein A